MKIKISKKVLFIIGIVIFAVVFASLINSYVQQVRDRDQVSASLSEQKVLLNKLNTEKADLENQRAQAEALLGTSQAKFPQSVESIEYGEDLFEIAGDCNLELIALSPSAPVDKKVGSVTYSVAIFVVTVEGNIDDTLDFIQAIRTGDDFQLPWSAEVKGVNINIARSEATINLDIYAYKR